MEESLSKKLLEYLQHTEDFVIEQAPDIIQQTLRYHYISSLIGMILSLSVIFILSFILYKSYFYPTLDKYQHRELSNILGCLLPIGSLLPLTGIFLQNLDTFLKINIAPKYFLISLFK